RLASGDRSPLPFRWSLIRGDVSGLDLLRHHERRTVAGGPREQVVRLGVADEPLGLAVERERASQTVGDVPEVRQGRGKVPLLDLAVQLAPVTGADRVHEVLVVGILDAGQDAGVAALLLRERLSGPLLFLAAEV